MKGPVKQHILPKTYLKHFAVNPSDRRLRSFVWVQSMVTGKPRVSMESIDSSKFKIPDYYSVPTNANPYAVEEYFCSEIEPLYNGIMDEVVSEQNLSLSCRSNLILWLYNIKYRNNYNRNNIQRNLENLVKFTEPYYSFDKRLEPPIARDQIASGSKQIHLESLLRQDLLNDFEKGMATKHWIVLKSRTSNKFLTNDNPGFSINIDFSKPDFKSLTSYFATNSAATNYFVMSPNYCLMISPFWEGTPLELSLKNQTFEFKVTNKRHIQFINYCTSMTRSRFVIASDKAHFL